MQGIGNQKSRRWMTAALVAFLLVGGFLWSNYDVLAGIWTPFGLPPSEWPMLGFGSCVLIAIVLGLVFRWAARGRKDARRAAEEDRPSRAQPGEDR